MIFPRVQSFFWGFKLPAQALKLILQNRALLILSLVPILITLLLSIYIMGSLSDAGTEWIRAFLSSKGWNDLGWLTWISELLVKILTLLVGGLIFIFASSIVASPFNDFLAEKAEPLATPPLPKAPSTGMGGQIRNILIDLGKTIAAATAGLLALLLSWIPIINFVTFAIAFLLITFQYVSYPQTRRGITLVQGLSFLWNHAYACLGFGACISLLVAIPLVSVLILPIAVVGGTLLVARAQAPSSSWPRLH